MSSVQSTQVSNDGPVVAGSGRGGAGRRSKKGRGNAKGNQGSGTQEGLSGCRSSDNNNEENKSAAAEISKKSPDSDQSGLDSQKQPPPKTQPQRVRNQRGKQQQQQKSKKNSKASNPEPSDEERIRLENEMLEQEAAAALKKQQEEIAKIKADRQKEQLSRETTLVEAKDVLLSLLDESKVNATNRLLLEADQLELFRKDFEVSKKKLKTDLKKCTAFVKKVKSGVVWSMRPTEIQQEVASLNLSRYVEEVVQAITETNIKVSDLSTVTALCIAMHQRYADFLGALLPSIWSVVLTPSAETLRLRRLYVRLLVEFLLNGLVPSKDIKVFTKCITDWTGANAGYAVQDANLIVAFGRAAGFEIFGITARSILSAFKTVALELERNKANFGETTESSEGGSDNIDTLTGPVMLSPTLITEVEEISTKLSLVLTAQRAISTEASETLRNHFFGAYSTLTSSLAQTHRKLQKLEKRCEQDRLLSGSLTEVREKGLSDARKLMESLHKSVETLSDCLDQDIPTLLDDNDDENSQSGAGVEVWTKNGEGEGQGEDFGPFDDEETRSFYCEIPDLISTFPPALLGLQPEDIDRQKSENLRKYGSDSAGNVDVGDPLEEVGPASEEQLEAAEKACAIDDEVKSGDTSSENTDTPHYRLMMLLEQELPECHRREQIDEITEKFCSTHGSSRNSRKRLLNTLFLVPRNRLDLLPYYSRMAATVDRIWTDIASNLVSDLEQQFHGQTKFKKNQNLDSRMKTARYIGELTKFRVAPPIIALRCIQRCIEDFTGSNVDVACCILESCGRFLYRTKHANARLVTLMDTMTRLKKAKNLDDRLQASLTAAYFSVKPPPTGPRRKAKEYTPLESYLRHLLLIKLESTSSSISSVTKQLLRLPWNDPSHQCGYLVSRLMLKACRKGRYKTIEAIAGVAAKLRNQRAAGESTIRLIDSVIEELRWSLENPNFRDQQRIVTYARLYGEFYCSGLITGQIVLDQLYDFINVGHEIPDSLREACKKFESEKNSKIGSALSMENMTIINSSREIPKAIMEEEILEEGLPVVNKVDALPIRIQPIAVSVYSKHDPRVPSLTDPPNSFFRITLVCSLLDVVAKSIVTKSNLPRLKGFLAAFQRYLFTKDSLPTDVEFSLLDTFDIIESYLRLFGKNDSKGNHVENELSGFTRFASWLDAQNATVAMEETEAIFEMQKRARLEGILDCSKHLGEFTDQLETHSLQDDDTMSEDDDDDGTLSLSAKDSVDGIEEDIEIDDEENEHSIPSDEEKVDMETESNGETDEEDVEEEEEFDEEAYLRQLQEDTFERELRRITMDALEKGKSASRKQVGESMISGSQIVRKKDQSKPMVTCGVPQGGIALGGKAGITFQLLKKGSKGKVEAKELLVPVDTNLALVATKQDDAAARERDEIKRKVLRYEAESAEAEFSGGNVYLEQEKLQVIRNRPLLLEEIDRNFGTSGGNLRQNQEASKPNHPVADGRGRGIPGRGSGRGGRMNLGGRRLFG